ncbi:MULTISPECIES: sensor histidine kinase [unclassified Streptomyces]|uniref:histidine kinase n=1 Tax=Streptomyces sp. NBC_00060 TaxID=2975636 RepID=A0AAU2GUX6_9ACTN
MIHFLRVVRQVQDRVGAGGRSWAWSVRRGRNMPGVWGDMAAALVMAAFAVHVGVTRDGGFVQGNLARTSVNLMAVAGFFAVCRWSAFAYGALAAYTFVATDFYVPLTAAAFALGAVPRQGRLDGRALPALTAMSLTTLAGALGAYREAGTQCPADIPRLYLPCGVAEATYRSATAVITAYALGTYLRRSRGMRRLNSQLRQEHHRHAEQARLMERTRIAREMHDSLGHHLALTNLYAGALARTRETSTEWNRLSQVVVESNAAAAETLHRVVKVLRSDVPDDGPPAVADAAEMDALVARVRRTGAPVTGPAGGWAAFGILPADIRPTLFRVLQESLTNATKYAPGAEIRITLTHEDDTADLTVVSGPPSAVASTPSAPGGGFGLVGLRERVTLLGGRFEARPTDTGGFRVRALIPSVPHRRKSPNP